MSGDIWDWYQSFAEQVYEQDVYGVRAVEMIELFEESMQDDDDLARNRSLLMKAKRISESLGEDLFTLWCDVWLAQVLDSMGELKKSRELLSAAAARARAPKYNGTPQQMMANVKLVNNLATSDPIGYADEIMTAYEYVRSNCGDAREHELRILNGVVILAMESKDWEKLKTWIDRVQEIATMVDPDDLWAIGYFNAKIACAHSNWESMLMHADQALRDGNADKEAKGSLALARACALAGLGDSKAAKKEYLKGWRLRDSLADGDDYWFSALYWLNLNDVENAIQLRLKQQDDIKKKGRFWEQAGGAKHLIDLYAKVGDAVQVKRWQQQLAKVCKQLRDPSRFEQN